MVLSYETPYLSIENLSRDLEQNRNRVVQSLLERTVSGSINIDHEPGRTFWREIFQYYESHGLNEELLEIEVKLFNKTSPKYLTEPVCLLAEVVGALISAASIGFVPGRNIAGPIYGFFTKTRVRKRLAA